MLSQILMLHQRLQTKFQNKYDSGNRVIYGAMPQLVQDPVGNRICYVNPCFEGSSPSRSVYAVCPVGRGCCFENSLDVKVSGVRIPNMAFHVSIV